LASTFLPITPQTPKELGFGGFMPFRVRRDTPFGLKMLASWRNGISDYRTFWPRISGQRIFYFSVVIFFGSSSLYFYFVNFLGQWQAFL
jgi:hypothetical protein